MLSTRDSPVAFSITHTDGGFYLGMDIVQTDNRFITLTSETYIKGLCARELPKPISAYTATATTGAGRGTVTSLRLHVLTTYL